MRIDIISEGRDLLGECPLWDDRTGHLYWIDSRRHLVQRLHPATGDYQHWTLPGEVGSIALCESGRLLVALVSEMVWLDPVSGAVTPWMSIEHPAERMRLNDGRTDRAGRFCVGSLVLGRQEFARCLPDPNSLAYGILRGHPGIVARTRRLGVGAVPAAVALGFGLQFGGTAQEGQTLMKAATYASVPGISADCGSPDPRHLPISSAISGPAASPPARSIARDSSSWWPRRRAGPAAR